MLIRIFVQLLVFCTQKTVIDYYSLPLDRIIAFTEDMKEYGSYANSVEAANKTELGKYWKVALTSIIVE